MTVFLVKCLEADSTFAHLGRRRPATYTLVGDGVCFGRIVGRAIEGTPLNRYDVIVLGRSPKRGIAGLEPARAIAERLIAEIPPWVSREGQ